MPSRIRNVRGTRDLIDNDYKILKFVQDTVYRISLCYSFVPIDTPIIEFAEVFKRSLDTTSDIINKEIYTFHDRSDAEISLRPEFTASLARAFVQNLQHHPLPLKLFSIGPLFRYERPQKGRMRQFNQFNFEIMGAEDYHYDVEIIQIATAILAKLDLRARVFLEINSLGDSETKFNYKKALTKYLMQYYEELSEDSKKRLHTNTLRIFDSKDQNDQKILDGAPKIDEYYNQESEKYFNNFKDGIKNAGIQFKINHKLVRGLDYYSHMVFEFKTEEEKSQNTVIGGGRYEGLIEAMGGNKLSCIGFAGGIERLINISNIKLSTQMLIAMIPIGKTAETIALEIVDNLRKNDFCVEYLYGTTLKKRMSKAAEKDIALILGDDEVEQKKIKLKYMKTQKEEVIDTKELSDYLNSYKH